MSPSSDGWFPRSSDASELERCSREHARALDRNINTHQAHTERLTRLEERADSLDDTLRDLSLAVAQVRGAVKVAYWAIPLLVAIVSLAVRLWK